MAKRNRSRRPSDDQLPLDLRTKWCSHCARELPTWDFARNRARRDGLSVYCRPCRNASESKRYYECAKIREKSRRRSRACYERNKAAVSRRSRKWYEQNRNSALAYSKSHYQANREKRLAQSRARYLLSRDKWRAASRRWRQNNREAVNAKSARRRAREASVQTVHFTVAQLAQRWSYYGDKCWVCRAPATATDHVKPIAKGGAHMLCNLRPVCQPCNSSKSSKWPFTPDMIRSAA